jgi:hypothetical protein
MKTLCLCVFLMIVSLMVAPLPPSAVAQAPVCGPAVLIDIARAASTCFRLEAGQACVGNGNVLASGFDGTTLMTQAGDRATLRDISTISVESVEDDLGVATLALDESALTIIAFGDVSIRNRAQPLATLNALATGSVNIRSTPDADAEIIARAGVNDGILLNGRSADNGWVRLQVPNGGGYGWAVVDVLNVQGNLLSLVVASEDDPIIAPFRALDLTTGGNAACDGALHSGVLLQSGNNSQLTTLQLGETVYGLQGTAFASSSAGAVDLYVLAGYAVWTIDSATRPIPAGAWAAGDGTITPFTPSDFSALPLQLLPVPIGLPDAISVADITRFADEYAAAQTAADATPTPQPTADPSICRRVTRRDVTLYAGPGDFYEAINNLETGVRVDPVVATRDPDGQTWWQLFTSNWLLASDVRETGICDDVPITQTFTPPRANSLSLESCETTNGPLRVGQQVTIQFTPPAFDNLGEARDAPRIDAGRISIGARTYRAQVTEPIQLGTVGVDDRYLRTFYIVWTAVAGTHRIVGDRLSYEPICTLVVPVG